MVFTFLVPVYPGCPGKEAVKDPVYTMQPVVKAVEQPVECLFTQRSRLFNRLDNRLYRVNAVKRVFVLFFFGQAQRIYDTELATAAADRRLSSAQIPAEHVEVPVATTLNLVRVAPARENGNVRTEVEEGAAGQRTGGESQSVDSGVVAGAGDVTDPASSSTQTRRKTMWQSAVRSVTVATSSTSSECSDSTRWQRTLTKVTRFSEYHHGGLALW